MTGRVWLTVKGRGSVAGVCMSEGCTAERRSMQAKEQLWLKNKAASTAMN